MGVATSVRAVENNDSVAPVSADAGSILISPTKLNINIDPGQTYHGSFIVKNDGDIPEVLRPVATPYSVSGEDYLPDYDTEGSYTQIHKWVTFAESEYPLEPGAEAVVEYTITVPDDIPAGGQYAALLMEVGGGTENMFNTITRVGPVLIAQVNGETRTEGRLLSQTISDFNFDQPPTISATFENTGNVDYTVTSKLQIRNLLTGEIAYTNIESPLESTVFPATTRVIPLPWDDSPSFGIFQIEYEVDFLGESYAITRTIFFCPLWAMVILIVIIISLIILLVIWIARHRHRARALSMATSPSRRPRNQQR